MPAIPATSRPLRDDPSFLGFAIDCGEFDFAASAGASKDSSPRITGTFAGSFDTQPDGFPLHAQDGDRDVFTDANLFLILPC